MYGFDERNSSNLSLKNIFCMDTMDAENYINTEFNEWMELMQHVKINTHVDSYLASASDSLEFLTDNHIAAFVYDYSAGNYSYMNEYFVRLMGKTREQIRCIGVKMMQELTHPEDFLKCLNLISTFWRTVCVNFHF